MAGIGLRWGPEAPGGGRSIDTKALVSEFVGIAILMLVGCGSVCAMGASDPAGKLAAALAFGLGITALACTFGPHSGCQINSAVTLSLVLGGECTWYQGAANCVVQFMGALTGSALLAVLFQDCSMDRTGSLATTMVNPEYGPWRGLLGEAIGTFALCFIVWETGFSPAAKVGRNGSVIVGAAVIVIVLFLLPITGASLNPPRSFGSAVMGAVRDCGSGERGLRDLWVMFLGPLTGGILAALVKRPFFRRMD